MSTLEIFKITLLVFTLLILVYVLYKRLISLLRKNNVRADYPSIGNSLKWINERTATLEIDLEMKTELQIELFTEKSDFVREVLKKTFNSGHHQVELNLTDLQPGRYYYKVVSDKQQASQYFILS
ncbi:MAG: hypothetical protein ACKVOK_07495 [Flavobacteriales bacterium]